MRLEVDLGAVAYDVSLAAERQRLLDTFTPADVICKPLISSKAFPFLFRSSPRCIALSHRFCFGPSSGAGFGLVS